MTKIAHSWWRQLGHRACGCPGRQAAGSHEIALWVREPATAESHQNGARKYDLSSRRGRAWLRCADHGAWRSAWPRPHRCRSGSFRARARNFHASTSACFARSHHRERHQGAGARHASCAPAKSWSRFVRCGSSPALLFSPAPSFALEAARGEPTAVVLASKTTPSPPFSRKNSPGPRFACTPTTTSSAWNLPAL